MTPTPPAPSFEQAARAFRAYFAELRALYLEREALFTQVELALLSREHVLVVGPPGTAKSALCAAVLGRIVDGETGAPSLFAKQLSESTVQTDLVGPVDFKVLTETGRTRHLVEEGMLGATHAFLDEVFDGRDMLLRAILNALYERELKQGRSIAVGRTQSVLMTSNRYLSEVLARSPELLLAFADRIGFVSFVPRTFVRPDSRATLLQRASEGPQPRLHASLTLQQLALLQEEAERVAVPPPVLEALEHLAEELERLLAARTAQLPELLPTKTFSQRSLVKALWVLRAAVVRDCALHRPERARVAGFEDLESLRAYFLLGGPPPEGVEALLREGRIDARERAQLERVRLEHRAFDEALAHVRAALGEGPAREARALHGLAAQEAADAIARSFEPGAATALAATLEARLVPGPRYAENRAPLLEAARALLSAAREALARPQPGGDVLAAGARALGLAQRAPELAAERAPLAAALERALEAALSGAGAAAQGAAFESRRSLAQLALRARELAAELERLRESRRTLPEAVQARLARCEQRVREEAASALARCAPALFEAPAEQSSLDEAVAQLHALEAALVALAPGQQGLTARLLAPLARAKVEAALAGVVFGQLGELEQHLRALAQSLRRWGLEPTELLGGCAHVLGPHLLAHVQTLQAPPALTPSGSEAREGLAYSRYRDAFAEGPAARELAALPAVRAYLPIDAEVGAQLSRALHEELEARVASLEAWFGRLREALPAAPSNRREAVASFDVLIHSRFPQLLLRDGELARLGSALALLEAEGEAARAAPLRARLESLQGAFEQLAQALLERGAAP
ncbi:AAA family ATPase [Aggregicoccus sp. 17bor-14]|uniref:AAA family ATPase n=1 Tax=Myxococcaceae TaxID=31 RepID=UPI0012F05387|nr:AAA family ATPase [Simulacricoccus sp. 17bor-14]MRI86919.1 AAA family ATPase [Aggregicoccus sp. 17bor-14]